MSLEQVSVDTACRLARVSRLIEQQQRFNAQVAAALERIEMTKQLQKRGRKVCVRGGDRDRSALGSLKIVTHELLSRQ
jgi:Fe-S cluster assembly ATPase SufC